jgi:hypothetical protein
MDKDKEIMDYCVYDDSSALTLLPVLELWNFSAWFLLESEDFLSHEMDCLDLNSEITLMSLQMITL